MMIQAVGDDAYGTMSFQYQLPNKTIGGVGLPPSGGLLEWSKWAEARGGTPIGLSVVLVTIQVVDDLAVVVDPPQFTHECLPLPNGVQVSPEGMGGGPVKARVYNVKFDGAQTVVEPGADSRSLSVAKGETERLLIQVEVGTGWYEWMVTLPVVVNGQRLLHQVNLKPFHTAGENRATLHMWDPDNAEWVPPPIWGQG